MNPWLSTFLDEKGINLDETFELTSSAGFAHFMSYDVIYEAILLTSKDEQSKIKNMLVSIDFKNGDVKHYLRHLGQGLVENRSHF
jgi:hypothetical protein